MIKIIIGACLIMLVSSCFQSKRIANIDNTKSRFQVDSLKKFTNALGDTSQKFSKLRPYKELISARSITDSGLFAIHKLDNKYYFEISDSLLGRDILIVTRISKAAAEIRPNYGFAGYAGDAIGESIVRFEKGPGDKLFLKNISYGERSYDSSENGMYRSVNKSNLHPIIAAFDIKAYHCETFSTVIDLTDYIMGDNAVFSFNPLNKKLFPVTGLQPDKSYIACINSFPINVEVQTVKTFLKAEGGLATYELNSSIVLLPEIPMPVRYYDPRIGYFATGFWDFDAPQEVKGTALITRWRLEPKDEDIAKYRSGGLVEPKKPIIYYIDPATPRKWIPYLIQGVKDWQSAFEKAGFKNAIIAMEAPTENKEWSLLDARHNAIVYKPSFVTNASGPHIHDPRTGEILETHINWYHNVLELLKNWYIVQAGPNDARARQMHFEEKLMGRLIRFVCAHEVGHTLGLMHNFGASSTIFVEKLRDKDWVKKNGICPSIMDYARFNYVAQPEDSISTDDLVPKIGFYDEWAIEWGYRWFPKFDSKNEELSYMNNWIIHQLRKDKRYWYGEQPFLGLISDSRCQSEDLGDDAMKAGCYGIHNLKRVMSQLINWTKEQNSDYSSLEKIREEVIKQYQRYLNHVVNNLCLPMWTTKTSEQVGNVLQFSSSTKLKEAVRFLDEQLFDTPEWIINKQVYGLIGGAGVLEPIQIQTQVLTRLVSEKAFLNLTIGPNSLGCTDIYDFNDLMNDLYKNIWKELKNRKEIDFYRRNLQQAYVNRLIQLFNPGSSSDFQVAIRNNIRNLFLLVNRSILVYRDNDSKLHLMNVRDKLKYALKNPFSKLNSTDSTRPGTSLNENATLIKPSLFNLGRINGFESYLDCWRNILDNRY